MGRKESNHTKKKKTPLDMYNGLSQVYCITPEEFISIQRVNSPGNRTNLLRQEKHVQT